MDEIKAETIELPATETVEAIAPQAPSREELKAKGWSKTELDLADKRGMIAKNGEAKDAKTQPEVKETAKPAEIQEKRQKEEPVVTERRVNGSWIDYEMTPEQEKVFLATFPPGTPQNGTHLRMKSERRARQQAEARARELEAQIQQIRTEMAQKTQPVIDENGNEIDPEDKPLTVKQWKALQAQEAEERQKQEAQIREQGNVVADSLKTQEEYAKSIFNDYDATVNLAKDLINNLDTYLPNKWEQERAVELIQALQVRAANADKFGLDDRNAAMISYEIGKLHPSYGRSSNHGDTAEPHNDGNSDKPEPKANGSLTPGEKMKRIETNTQRRASSASISGGSGNRVVSADEVTLKDLRDMTDQQRFKFKKDHPARFDKLLRG